MRSTRVVPGRVAYFYEVCREERGVVEVAVLRQSDAREMLRVEAGSLVAALADARRAVDRVEAELVRPDML